MILQIPNRSGRLIPVHHRHLDIHENDIIRILQRGFHLLHRAGTVLGRIRAEFHFLQHIERDLPVQFIIFHEQRMYAFKFGRSAVRFDARILCTGIFLFCLFQNKTERITRSFPFFAVACNFTIQHIYKPLHNRESESGAFDSGNLLPFFPLKEFELFSLEFLAHSDPVVTDTDLIHGRFLFDALFLRNRKKGIKNEGTCSALRQFKRPCNRILTATLRETGLFFSFRIFKEIQPNRCSVRLFRIYFLHNSVRRIFNSFNDAPIVHHEFRHILKFIGPNLITVFHQFLQNIRHHKVFIDLRFYSSGCCPRRIARLFFLCLCTQLTDMIGGTAYTDQTNEKYKHSPAPDLTI